MIRIVFSLVASIGLWASAHADAVDQATVDALAQSYTFGAAETVHQGCRITLQAAPVRSRDTRPVHLNSACRERFPVLRAVTRWRPTGGASVALFGGEPLHEIADFSPVQDGSGVYLRGGFEGDTNIYELRTPGS
jgi:hypothetical protein